MKICLKTLVNADLNHVWANFNKELFLKLAPPFPPVTLMRFDGCEVGNVVTLKLGFIFFSQIWESHITQQEIKTQEIFFVDEGKKLPFFLKYWQHKHILTKDANNCTIITDDITYKTPFWLLDYLLYPAMYLQFAYRKPMYKKYFKIK